MRHGDFRLIFRCAVFFCVFVFFVLTSVKIMTELLLMYCGCCCFCHHFRRGYGIFSLASCCCCSLSSFSLRFLRARLVPISNIDFRILFLANPFETFLFFTFSFSTLLGTASFSIWCVRGDTLLICFFCFFAAHSIRRLSSLRSRQLRAVAINFGKHPEMQLPSICFDLWIMKLLIRWSHDANDSDVANRGNYRKKLQLINFGFATWKRRWDNRNKTGDANVWKLEE